MKLKRPKWLLFQLVGGMLLVGVIVLGYYQFQWINTATRVEEQRILKQISIAVERALDEAFDEIRALISFAYVSHENIGREYWTDVDASIQFWSAQSPHPQLLANVILASTSVGGKYLSYDAKLKGFAPVEPPNDFTSYERYLEEGAALEAYRRAYPALLSKGYFLLPIFPPQQNQERNDENGHLSPVALLAVRIDTDLLLTTVFPSYLNSYFEEYLFRIVGNDQVYYSTLSTSEGKRRADVIVPIFGAVSTQADAVRFRDGGNGKDRLSEDAMRNPISRFWFLRTAGVLGIGPNRDSSRVAWQAAPRIEVFYPERSLESAMRGRQTASLLLSIGTLLVLLVAYFVLYILLARTDTVRMRERDFVTSMSHELRTPLSVISATSDNLSRGIVEAPERVQRYGGLIKAQALRLGKMVESILLYSGVEMMDSDKMRSEEIHLSSFFGEIVASLAPTSEEAGTRLVLSKDTHLSSVSIDGEALRIIAENLVMNAIRHGMPKGAGADRDEVSPEIRILVRTRPPRSLLVIVEDDGPGIPQSDIKSIFDAFVRGDRSKQDQTPGSGLGLHIVRRICTQMGGHVSVESPYKDMAGMPREGARFEVKVPFKAERKHEETDTHR